MSHQCECLETLLEESIKRNGHGFVSILQDIQEDCGYLPEDALRALARKTGVPLSEIYRTATFYNYFSLVPRGKHQVVVCTGTTCHVRGAKRVSREITKNLGIRVGEVTEDREFSLESVNCLGCCAFAPVVVVDGRHYGNLTPDEVKKVLDSVKREAVTVGAT
ncbi:MAG: NAD(P)H-dependent oxidoreductase subunit E [Bacillota bacterium]|jgi:NADH-quinone oxidoreductase subunit E